MNKLISGVAATFRLLALLTLAFIAAVLLAGAIAGLSGLVKVLLHSWGLLASAPRDPWQSYLIGFVLCLAGALLFIAGLLSTAGKGKIVDSLVESLALVFVRIPFLQQKAKVVGGAVLISRGVHGQSPQALSKNEGMDPGERGFRSDGGEAIHRRQCHRFWSGPPVPPGG